MRLPKIRELIHAVHAIFGRRYTSRFPAVAAVVPEGFRGVPRFDEKECVGCGACAVVCPAKDIEVTDEVRDGKAARRLTIHYDDCIFCAQCARNCPTGKGVVMTKDFNLATDNRKALRESVEKEMVCCEICGAPVAAKDHLLWIARRVGPSAYSNPTLMLAMINDLAPFNMEVPEKSEIIGRSDRLRVLCPKHRRESTLEFSSDK